MLEQGADGELRSPARQASTSRQLQVHAGQRVSGAKAAGELA
jgi:hypothetical protein